MPIATGTSTKWLETRSMEDFRVAAECTAAGEAARAFADGQGMRRAVADSVEGMLLRECEKTGGGVAEVLFDLDMDSFTVVKLDGERFVVKATLGENAGDVARVHCDGIGLDEAQCGALEEMVRDRMKATRVYYFDDPK